MISSTSWHEVYHPSKNTATQSDLANYLDKVCDECILKSLIAIDPYHLRTSENLKGKGSGSGCGKSDVIHRKRG